MDASFEPLQGCKREVRNLVAHEALSLYERIVLKFTQNSPKKIFLEHTGLNTTCACAMNELKNRCQNKHVLFGALSTPFTPLF